jgi:hypothetical protein
MSSRILRRVGAPFVKRFVNETSNAASCRSFSTTGVCLIKKTSNAQDPMDAGISGRKSKLELDTKQFGMKNIPLSAQKRRFNVTNDLNITQEEVNRFIYELKIKKYTLSHLLFLNSKWSNKRKETKKFKR